MIPGITASRRHSSGPAPDVDPYWDDVILLMHFDGDIIDQKGGAINQAGTISYTAGKFGQALNLATGNSGVVDAANRSLMDLPGDFTIEGFFSPNSGSSGAMINRFHSVSAGTGWQIYLESSGRVSFYEWSGSSGTYPISSAGPDIRDGNFHHVAATRSGSTLRLFVDGLLVGTGSTSINYTSTVALFSAGYQAQGSARYPMRGKIDEIRITKGVARYTANFTPPTQPFPNE